MVPLGCGDRGIPSDEGRWASDRLTFSRSGTHIVTSLGFNLIVPRRVTKQQFTIVSCSIHTSEKCCLVDLGIIIVASLLLGLRCNTTT